METATSKRYFDADPLGRGGYGAHIDVGTQADIRPPRPDVNASYSDDEYTSQGRSSRVVSGIWDSGRKYLSRVTSTRSAGGQQQHYSRQDFMEQYCVTPHQLKALDKIANAVNNHHGGGGLFGCLSSNQQGSVCSRSSLLSLCVGRQSNAAEDMAQYWPQKPPLRVTDLPPAPPPPQQAGRGGRGRYQWVPEQAEEAYHSLERPRPIPITGISNQDFGPRPEGCGGRLIGQGNMKITEEQIRQAQARMRGFNHTEPNTPMSSRKGNTLEMEDGRRGSKHVSFIEHRSGLVRSQTTSSFEEAHGHIGPAARWRMAAARSQERLLDGPMIKPKKSCHHQQQQQEENEPKPNKAVIMEKLKRAGMKTQATQTDLPLPAVVQKQPHREKRHHHHKHHHQHGYLSLSPRSMHKSTQAHRSRLMKSYSTSAGGSTTAPSQASDISCVSGSTSGWEHVHDSVDDDEEDEDNQQEEEERQFNERPIMQRSQSAQPSTRNKAHGKRDLSPRYKEIFIDFEPNPNKVSPQQSPKSKRPLHKTMSEGEILLERRRIQHSDYIDRQCESSATVEDAELYGRHFDPTSPEGSPPIPIAKKSSEGTDGTNGSLFSSSSLLDEEEFHENILLREGLLGKRRLSLDGRSAGRSDGSEFSDEKAIEEGERRPQSQPASVISSGLLLLPDNSKQTGGSSCDSLSVSGYTGSQQNTWRESQTTVIGINNSDPETMGSVSEMSTCSNQKRSVLLISQQKITLETEIEEEETRRPSFDRRTPSPQPPKSSSSPFSNKASPYQSPSLLRPSPGCADVSETSEDYVTATDNSGATDSSSRRNKPDGQHEPSGTSSSNLGEREGSFESASSMHSKDEMPLSAEESTIAGDSTPTPRPDLVECSTKAPAETASPSSPSAESSSSQGSYSLQGSSAADFDKEHSSSPSHASEKFKKHQALVEVHATEPKTSPHWGDEERAKAKRGFKLDLPSTPSPSKNDAPVTKPPRRKHQHKHVDQAEVTTPGMVRSPAMHQGFRPEDWVVSRASPSTSLPTPSSNIPPSERISPLTVSKAISPGSRRLQAKRHDSSSSSSEEEAIRRTPSPSARSPTTCKTLPRSPRRRPARSPTATLQRPRRKSVTDEMKGMSTSQTALPSVTYTASSVRRKSAPKINQPPSPVKGPDGKIVPPEKLLSPHPHHKFHSLDRKSGSNKASPQHAGVKTALSAESLRSVSPGSDSVFYDPQLSAGSPSTAIGSDSSALPPPQPLEAPPANGEGAFIVQPPEGFGDSPEGPKKTGGRLYKKLEKRRFKSEERGACNHQHKEGSSGTHPRRHQHRACKHATARAKSEERRGEKGENTKVASSRSANSSLELLRAAGSSPNMQGENPDEIGVIYGSFRSAFWLYISPRDEKLVWKKPLPATPLGSPPTSPEGSTCSERDFRRRYQAVTHRMVHRRASAEMFERMAARTFETEQTVTVRKGDGEFGFRIHGSRPVVVSAIEPATPAESSGLEVGDIVISVNGVNVLDASHSEVVKIAHAGSEVLQLEVARTRHLISPDDGDSLSAEGAASGVERCGHLMKRTPTGGHWVHRWFVLRADGCLYYYKTPSLESRPLGAILVSQYTVSAPDSATHSDSESDPVWLIRLLKDGCLALTLGADSQVERDQWLSSLYTAATTPIKWEDRLVNRGTLALSPTDIINPDCFGFLNKLGRRWRNWNRLYCVLKDACLFLFPTPDSPRASGLLCLHGYRVQNASAGGKRFAFDLLAPESKHKHFYLHTDTELDKKRWMAALEYSIDRWLKIT